MIRILMHGADGAMGQMITKLAKENQEAEIVAGVDISGVQLDAYPVYKTLEACQIDYDVIIDFSVAAAVDGLLDFVLAKKIPVVLCTTGLSKEQLEKVDTVRQSVAVLKSANMSLGVNTIFKLAAMAAEILATKGYDMEIVEKHHKRKLDAPSGTALAIADAINEAMNGEYHYTLDRSDRRQPRDPKEIGIQAVRGGTIVGEHEVFYCGEDEVIEIKHTAYSRGIFAKGALSAAIFLADKGPGLYTMSDVID